MTAQNIKFGFGDNSDNDKNWPLIKIQLETFVKYHSKIYINVVKILVFKEI